MYPNFTHECILLKRVVGPFLKARKMYGNFSYSFAVSSCSIACE